MNRKSQVLLMLTFFVLTPIVTFLLLCMRGLPAFAAGRLGHVLLWVVQVTWVPAAVSALLLTAVVSYVTGRYRFFHDPYDFGRCFSLGAILGAITEALATALYRAITRHPFSDFWIAGAMIAGCLVGAFLTAAALAYRAPIPPKS